ncbi:MAG: hypothetical protein AMJ54_16530 [Deltaproteobacteria bacterium SG8_13]|nr:MAG: hypothetical protein AMJ54_16530 [Deltaproteobacteria bacterium SG8_13]
MKKIVCAAAMLAFVLAASLSCSGPPKPTDEEKAAMEAFERVRDGVEAKVSYDQFEKLLADAHSQIENLKQVDKKNPCFMSAITRSYASYETCKKASKMIEAETDENRRIDLETTRSFMIGFASVSLSKAGECFKKK